MRVQEKVRRLDFRSPRPYFFPVLDASTPVWQHPTILVAYNFLPRYIRKLPLDYDNTLIMVESGGYLPKPPSAPDVCLQRQIYALPDLALTLDYPVKKGRGGFLPKIQKDGRVDKTIENAKRAMELKDLVGRRYKHDFEPVAVIQGYDIPSISRSTWEMQSFGYEFYALGCVTTEAASRHSPEIVERVRMVREIIGADTWLHVLGVMDIDLLCLIKNYITSFDATTLTKQAATGTLVKADGSFAKVPLHVRPDYIELQEKNFNNYLKRLKRYVWRTKHAVA